MTETIKDPHLETALERPSPNHDAREKGQPIDILLLHYTGMESAEAALERLCDPAAKVSAHYCIDEDGTLYRLVPDERRAWHAGVAYWQGATNINARSIGIELVNPGHEFGYRPFPEAQMAALIPLARRLCREFAIPGPRVLGHSDVAPARKEDPGELFDWARLAKEGIGRWPQPRVGTGQKPDTGVAEALKKLGYGPAEVPLDTLITAFQRHFQPHCVTGRADEETCALLEALLDAPPDSA